MLVNDFTIKSLKIDLSNDKYEVCDIFVLRDVLDYLTLAVAIEFNENRIYSYIELYEYIDLDFIRTELDTAYFSSINLFDNDFVSESFFKGYLRARWLIEYNDPEFIAKMRIDRMFSEACESFSDNIELFNHLSEKDIFSKMPDRFLKQ